MDSTKLEKARKGFEKNEALTPMMQEVASLDKELKEIFDEYLEARDYVRKELYKKAPAQSILVPLLDKSGELLLKLAARADIIF